MSEIQQGRYDQLLRRVADLKGPGSKVNDALTELFPVLDVENVPGELLFLQGTRLGMAGINLAPEVASIPKVQLFNPVGSGKLVTVTSIWVSAGTTQIYELFHSNVAITTLIGNNSVRDTRAGSGASTTTQLRTQLDAAGIPAFFTFLSLANVPQQITDPNGVIILSPGFGITAAPTGTNVSFFCSFLFRERLAEPSELNF